MLSLQVSEVARLLGTRLVDAVAAGGLLRRVVSDSREVGSGDLFVAIPGERVDGHDFVTAAAAAGAGAAIVERPVESPVAQIIVADSRAAVASLATHVRARRGQAVVIGITGSNGKTTVKGLTAALLSTYGPCWATPGNRNNELGLPLALIDAPEAGFQVFEMGAGAPGDIDFLATIARPSIGLVNNVGPAHLERLESMRGVAETKAAMYRALPPEGVAVINADDAFAPGFRAAAAHCQQLEYAVDASAALTASRLRREAEGTRFVLSMHGQEAELLLPLPGRHNVANALAAAAIATACGMELEPIARALAESVSDVREKGRLAELPLADGTRLIDDSYNANPGSTRAAISELSARPGRRVLILGDMRELGPAAAQLHADAGTWAAQAGIEGLLTLGEQAVHASRSFGLRAQHFATIDALIEALDDQIAPGDAVLVKGSRGSRMERVVNALVEQRGGLVDAA